jgi:hypothetical protein
MHCNTYNIKSQEYDISKSKSSLGLYGCVKPEMLQMSNEIVYKVDREPSLCKNKPQYEYLNKNVNESLQKYDCMCKLNGEKNGCEKCQNTYTNYHDGRFMNSAGIRTFINDTPYDDMYNTNWWNLPPKFSKNFDINTYPDYENINKGTSLYKVDRDYAVPFNDPLFTMRGNVYHTLQSTPMGKVYSKYHLDVDNKTMNSYSNLSQLNDQSYFREMLISTFATPNQTEYTRRYYS